MRWSSNRSNSLIAATICGIFAVLILLGVRALTVFTDKGKVTLNDIFQIRDIYQYEPDSYVVPHQSGQEPTMPEATLIDSSKTDCNVKVQVEYYIILESFKDLMHAQQKAEKSKNDLNTNIIILPPTKESYYRISYGKYSTLEEAKSAIKSIRTNIRSDAWIYSEKKEP
jgi:hypothetical protein